VQIADVVFRQGHLSEDLLTTLAFTGDRPEHLASCTACSQRLREIAQGLDEARLEAVAEADAAFTPEKLALQQSQILRKLEQLDVAPRVIAFPAQPVAAPRDRPGRRVAPAWVGVAAAAGLVIGAIGGQFSARLAPEAVQPPAAQNGPAAPAPTPATQAEPINASLLDYDLDRHIPDALLVYDQLTPTLVQGQYASAR
jgi:hypothetical protein